jgi:coatomer subunit beta'
MMYILGYIPGDNRLYLSDKELHVISFQLLLSVLEYQGRDSPIFKNYS